MKHVFDENREIINNAMLCIIVHGKHALPGCVLVEVNTHLKLDNMTLSATVPLY